MAWDSRGYYYKSRRIGGRVVRDYFGSGAAGQLAEAFDLDEHDRIEFERFKVRAVRQQLEQEDREAARASRIVQERLSAALEASGYRRHHRGEWRRTRAR